MSINFLGITFVVDCDFCSESLDTDRTRDDGFMAAVAVLKREGWRAIKDGHEGWLHKCPACQEKR